MNDPVRMKRETIQIEGPRDLYNYTFEIVDSESDAAKSVADSTGNLKPDSENNG